MGGGLKALNDLGGATDGFHPAADPDWLLSALNRGGGQAFDFLAPDDGFAPPPIPTGFYLDLTDRKAADDFLLYGAGEPEPEPEPTPVDDVIVPGVRTIPGSTVGITIGDIPDPFGGDPGEGGQGSEPLAPDVPRDLSQRSCSDLAYYEYRVDSDISSARGLINGALSILDPFQQTQVFDEIWSSFQRQYEQPGMDSIDPSFNLWAIWNETRDPVSLLGASARSMFAGIGAEATLFIAFERLFQATLDKARIDAAQAAKGCGG
jgi:hypothetical protein